jgi:hypothetical protein
LVGSRTGAVDPKPFGWSKTADQILDTLATYCTRINDSRHLKPRPSSIGIGLGGGTVTCRHETRYDYYGPSEGSQVRWKLQSRTKAHSGPVPGG